MKQKTLYIAAYFSIRSNNSKGQSFTPIFVAHYLFNANYLLHIYGKNNRECNQ